ncbi:glycosyltransferase [bacterium]|nr:glycosyltransferase [bacterium]
MIKTDESNNLKICLVGPAYPYRGGISHYTTCLAKELRKKHRVYLVNYKRLYPKFLFPGKTQFDESKTPLIVESDRIIDSINPLSWVKAAFRIVRFNADMVVVQWWHPYFAPAIFTINSILRILGRGKIIFICHNVVPHEQSVLDGILARIAFFFVEAFIVQSKEDRDNLLGIKKNADLIVHPLPLFDFFKKGEINRQQARDDVHAVGENIILFFGYVRPYKGLQYLLEAMPLILEKIKIHLYVVGEFYEDSTFYKKLVREKKFARNVTFVERYVDNDEVEKYFVASDLVVLPYISATQSAIAQIALAFDRPIVVTKVGGLPEVVSEEKTGFIVPPADPEALASAVIKFFKEGWGTKMLPYFKEEKKRFAWGGLVSALEELFRK